MSHSTYSLSLIRLCAAGVLAAAICAAQPQTTGTQSRDTNDQPRDPGVRLGFAGAGKVLPGVLGLELTSFNEGQTAFQEVDGVAEGLGPRFNLDSCAGCHAFPAIGGTSPEINPQVAMATTMSARNTIPWFVTSNGPIREARFKRNPDGSRDGGVHGLFTIKGRTDARGCNIDQPDFSNRSNLSFRIPTPVFGAGLIEAISDSMLKTNLQANSSQKTALGISGHLNTSGNDGTVTRFGWKAQNKSLLVFSGEAYNVEQGITNMVFMTERDENAGCSNELPEDGFPFTEMTDVIEFANFMRLLDQPRPAAPTESTLSGRSLFQTIGCALCHTPSLTTGHYALAALANQTANLYSDLALHNMGTNLADDIMQGDAGPDEFRTAPLWGLGQRVFFLHDGRSTDLLDTIKQHSGSGSEANAVIEMFKALPTAKQQDLLNFLRSL